MARAPLTIIFLEGDERAAAIGELARELEPINVDTGLASVEQLCERAAVFQVAEGNQVRGHYALTSVQHPGGVEGLVLAAAVHAPGRDMTAFLLPTIERQFIDVAAVTIYTKRKGLVRKAARQGYGVEGYVLRKRMTPGGHA